MDNLNFADDSELENNILSSSSSPFIFLNLEEKIKNLYCPDLQTIKSELIINSGEVVDVHYLDDDRQSTNDSINVDKQKFSKYPLASLRDYLPSSTFLFLSRNFDYKLLRKLRNTDINKSAYHLLHAIFLSDNSDWFKEYISAIASANGGTANTFFYSMSEDYHEAYSENKDALHRRATRLLNVLTDLKILTSKKIKSNTGRQANFYCIPDGDQELINTKESLASYNLTLKHMKKKSTPKESTPIINICRFCKHEAIQRKAVPTQQCPKCNKRKWYYKICMSCNEPVKVIDKDSWCRMCVKEFNDEWDDVDDEGDKL